jgi:hypothetical protein
VPGPPTLLSRLRAQPARAAGRFQQDQRRHGQRERGSPLAKVGEFGSAFDAVADSEQGQRKQNRTEDAGGCGDPDPERGHTSNVRSSPARTSATRPSPTPTSPALPSPARTWTARTSPALPSPARTFVTRPSPTRPSATRPSPARSSPALPSPARTSPAHTGHWMWQFRRAGNETPARAA